MPTEVDVRIIGIHFALNPSMDDNIQYSRFSGANTEEMRESHADSVEFTQENEVQAIETDSSKSFEILMASLASLTLIGFLLALWRTLA